MANQNKVGLVIGGFVGLLHLAWSVLIALGWAQPLMDFIFKLHMIDPVYHVAAFSLKKAGALVVVTFVVGYVLGLILATLWNKVHKE